MPDLEPITREEKLLDGEDLTPITRKEQFIKRIYDKTQEIPEPITREEMFLKKAGEGGGGDIDLQDITITENGEVTAPSGVAYKKITTNVPLPANAYLKKSVSGLPQPIASFNDGADAPLNSLTASIVPVQAGSGEPSPTNVRPISGWTEANVWNGGKNYLNTIQDNVVMVNGWEAPPVISNQSITYNIPEGAYFFLLKAFKIEKCHVGKTYVMSYNISPDRAGYTKFVICNADGGGRQEKALTATITNADVGKLLTVRFYPNREGNYTITNIQVEEGSEPTTYEPYAGTTTTIPFTDSQGNPVEVYGGSLDVVSGVLTVDRAYIDMGTINWVYSENARVFGSNQFTPYVLTNGKLQSSQYEWNSTPNVSPMNLADGKMSASPYFNMNTVMVKDSRYSDETAFKQAVSGVQLVYELATPLTIQLTPTSIKSLDGENNVFASTGEIEALEFFTKEA